MPMPLSPRAMTASMAPSLISTDPDWASRRNISPVATATDFKAARAASTVASFVRRSLTAKPAARCGWHGGAGCARAADRPRRPRAEPSGGERTGRRARDPDPGTGPATRTARRSLELPTNDDARDADRWLRVGDWRSLTVLSTCARGVPEI